MHKTILLSIIGFLAAAGTANAQVTATATPQAAGKATIVHFDIDGTAAPISSRIPSALSVTVPPGFTLDPSAIPARCSRTSAALNECPAASQVGTGTLTITVFYQGRPRRDVTFNLRMYMHSLTSVLAVTFLAGVKVVPASLLTTGGITLDFNPLPAPPVFQEVSYALKQIRLNLGVIRKVVHIRKHRVHDRIRLRRKRVVHSLLHNPTSCTAGSWGASVSLSFPDGTSLQLPAPISCTP